MSRQPERHRSRRGIDCTFGTIVLEPTSVDSLTADGTDLNDVPAAGLARHRDGSAGAHAQPADVVGQLAPQHELIHLQEVRSRRSAALLIGRPTASIALKVC